MPDKATYVVSFCLDPQVFLLVTKLRLYEYRLEPLTEHPVIKAGMFESGQGGTKENPMRSIGMQGDGKSGNEAAQDSIAPLFPSFRA
jgi:hypothetical protein